MPTARRASDAGGRARPAVPRGRGRPAGRATADGALADRAALLDAAEQLIRAQGPGVTLAAIAAQAGVTKPMVYRGLGDKDAVVQALAERLVARMTRDVRALVAGATGPRDQLQRFVAGYLGQAAADRNVYLYVTAGGSSDDRVRQALLLADRSAHQFAEGIAAMRRANGADPAVAAAWSYGLIGMLHFVTLWWLRDGAPDQATLAAQITELLWSGLGGDRPDPPPTGGPNA